MKDYQGRRRPDPTWTVPDTVDELFVAEEKALRRNRFATFFWWAIRIGALIVVWLGVTILVVLFLNLADNEATAEPSPARSAVLCGEDIGGC